MPRKRNEFYEAAKAITEAMNPDPRKYEQVFAMNRRHMSMLCNPDKSKGGKTYLPEIVLAAWLHLKEKLEADGLSTPSLMALLNDNPNRVEQFIQWLKDNTPAVFEVDSYDRFVEKYAGVLKVLGFTYQGWSDESDQWSKRRLTYDQVEALGLLPR